MKDMFSIGELARYQNISKQTLIFYDKIGLFRPAYVDPDNKYRYYKASQIDYLDTILIMKEMGFSLGEIQEHMKTYTINTSLIALRKQLTVLDQQIRHLQLVRNRLAHRCEQMENVKEVRDRNQEVTIKEINRTTPAQSRQHLAQSRGSCRCAPFAQAARQATGARTRRRASPRAPHTGQRSAPPGPRR